ncbi:MAG TPA: type II toxin-antitoxin system prevent-host-death family antitoxin [Phycisphaerae bacterium]|nr:type II toxin-antitoxin system prevent-host-death family antitoxin [Phycisphaerae bacterium]
MGINTVGIYDAKNKLSELLDRVEAGETITLTRHGKKVALLMSVNQQRPSARQAIARLRDLRIGSRLGGLKVKDLRDEGRP